MYEFLYLLQVGSRYIPPNVRLAKEYGVAVKMITGDHLLIAMETSRVLDMGGVIQTAEGLPLLDPETKAKPANLGPLLGMSWKGKQKMFVLS